MHTRSCRTYDLAAMLDDVITFVPTTDRARAREFYAGTLGLDLVDENPFALVFRLGATMLRVTTVESFAPQPFTVLGWRVPDVEEAIRTLTARGVTFERYDRMEQDALGVWTAPDGGRIAWFKDPDGNTLSVAELTA
jgi:catechol 2,3-dioxygenase-like lactoylglutathione lyase family enzyme